MFDLRPWDIAARLRDGGVWSNAEVDRIRFVTHLDVTRADVDETVAVWRELAAGWPLARR